MFANLDGSLIQSIPCTFLMPVFVYFPAVLP